MAEIKVLKIDPSGVTAEHSTTSDWITMTKFVAGTSLEVSGGIKINDTSVIFANDTDTLTAPGGSIQVQNLLDKTATETVSGAWTFTTTPQNTGAISNNDDMVTKEYVDQTLQNIDWQESVQGIIASSPTASSLGDRWIVESGATGTFAGQDEKIAEFFASWVYTTPNEGFAAYVENEDIIYVYNGSHPTGDWVKLASIQSHNNLAGLQGGNGSDEYYHMTATEDTWLASALTAVPSGLNLVDKTGTETISGAWTFTSTVTITNGELNLPTSSSTSPVEGGTYWDSSNDILYVYNGTGYQDVSTQADANRVKETFTASGAIAQYDPVYIIGDDSVSPADADIWATGNVIGVAPVAITSTQTGDIVTHGLVESALSGVGGVTAGKLVFLAVGGGFTVTPPSGSADVVLIVGTAKNTTDLLVDIKTPRRRAA